MATKKKTNGSKVALTVVVVLVLLYAVGRCGSSDDKSSSSPSSRSTTSSSLASASPVRTAAATPAVAPAGSAVRDGKFEFRVLGMTRAAQAGDLSNQFEIIDAQGEFIIVTMSVTNIGEEARSFSATNQKLIDSAGRVYSANSGADLWMNKGTGEINPGNHIQVTSAFDVPPGTVPAELEVHDSMFSGGVKVHL